MKRLLVLSFAILGFASVVHASVEVAPPADPFSIHEEEFDFAATERAVHYINLITEWAVTHGRSPEDIQRLTMEAVEKMSLRLDPKQKQGPLTLLNSALFELSVQYRHHSSQGLETWIDRTDHREIREISVNAAKVMVQLMAKLPDVATEINNSFERQRSKSTPKEVLKSYQTPRVLFGDTQAFFAGELDADLKLALTNMGKPAWVLRGRQLVDSIFSHQLGLKSSVNACRRAFAVKILAP